MPAENIFWLLFYGAIGFFSYLWLVLDSSQGAVDLAIFAKRVICIGFVLVVGYIAYACIVSEVSAIDVLTLYVPVGQIGGGFIFGRFSAIPAHIIGYVMIVVGLLLIPSAVIGDKHEP